MSLVGSGPHRRAGGGWPGGALGEGCPVQGAQLTQTHGVWRVGVVWAKTGRGALCGHWSQPPACAALGTGFHLSVAGKQTDGFLE